MSLTPSLPEKPKHDRFARRKERRSTHLSLKSSTPDFAEASQQQRMAHGDFDSLSYTPDDLLGLMDEPERMTYRLHDALDRIDPDTDTLITSVARLNELVKQSVDVLGPLDPDQQLQYERTSLEVQRNEALTQPVTVADSLDVETLGSLLAKANA